MDNCQESTAIVLDQLANVITSRKNADPEISYTAQLLNDGLSEIARKVGEEAVECVVSSFSSKKKELIDESADLLYHLFDMEEIKLKMKNIYSAPNNFYSKRNEKLLKDVIDPTSLLTWIVKNYPESKKILMGNPNYQDKF